MVVGIDNISPGDSTGKTALGGMRNYLQDLLDLLPVQRRGWRFKLITPEWADPFERRNPEQVEIVPCRMQRGRLARVMFEQFSLPRVIRENGIDVWLGTCNTLPVSADCRKALVVQSLQFFTHPGTYSWRQKMYLRPMVTRSIRDADQVIALSGASKQEITKRFGVAAERVDVVHHCLQGHLQQQTGADDTVTERLMGCSGPFVMMVSALYPYKNHARLIAAFARVHEEFPLHRLVIVGADSPGLRAGDLLRVAESQNVRAKVQMLGRVSSADLASLYRRADVMAMPSIDETFGLTVLEAMHFGCPVITSNVSSMAEVGGSAAVLVDPLSVDAIVHALRQVLGSGEMRSEMRTTGLKQAALFSKDRMVERTNAVIEAAARAYREVVDAENFRNRGGGIYR